MKYAVMFEVCANVVRHVEASSPEEAEAAARNMGDRCLGEIDEAYIGHLVSVDED